MAETRRASCAQKRGKQKSDKKKGYDTRTNRTLQRGPRCGSAVAIRRRYPGNVFARVIFHQISIFLTGCRLGWGSGIMFSSM